MVAAAAHKRPQAELRTAAAARTRATLASLTTTTTTTRTRARSLASFADEGSRLEKYQEKRNKKVPLYSAAPADAYYEARPAMVAEKGG